MHMSDVVTYSGPHIGLASMAGPGPGAVNVTRLLGPKGTRDSPVNAVGLTVLPCSRILLVATEDGFVKVCK